MKIVNNDLLAKFRHKTVCEFCGKKVATGLHPHHIYSRGAGQLDIAINLIALCPPFTGNNCHGRVHTAAIARAALLSIVAKREGKTVAAIKHRIYKLRRSPKRSK